MASSDAAPEAAAVYDGYLKDEIGRQDARQASFEQRGLAVVTTSGTLVTLLFALSAISTAAGSSIDLGHGEHNWLTGALVLFVAAATCALATNVPLKYKGPETSQLLQAVTAQPEDTPQEAVHAIAEVRAEILEAAQKKNTLKERLLVAALALEVLAVTFVGAAIVDVLHPSL